MQKEDPLSKSLKKTSLKIGLTFDLRDEYLAQGFSKEETIELDSEVTVSSIESVLKKLGHDVSRIGSIYALTKALARGERWDLVFNIAEGMFYPSREAQVPALLDAYRIPYTFSAPLALCLTLNKEATKSIAREHGIYTAPSWLVTELADTEKIPDSFPLFAKPNYEGSSKGIGLHSYIDSRKKLTATCSKLLRQFKQPVLVEEYLPHNEYTVAIIGTGEKAKVLGVMEITLKDHSGAGYSYENKVNYLTTAKYTLAEDEVAQKCGELALRAWRALGCFDCGRIDIKLDKNRTPAFVEVNPLAGLNPDYSDLPILCGLLKIKYENLIRSILNSAMERIKKNYYRWESETCSAAQNDSQSGSQKQPELQLTNPQ